MATSRQHRGDRHAVVIGASMAGLAVARALATGFPRVTVIDRDRLPGDAAHRRGVGQGRHLHVLLTAGGEALEQLFPGLLAELVAGGATAADLGVQGRTWANGHLLARGPVGREDVLATRPFVESRVRARLRADPRVRFVDGCRVRALVTSPDRARVTGVEVAGTTGPAGGGTRTLGADLVVDCSGRSSPVPAWLATLGYRPPQVDELRVDVRYATRHYRLPREALGGAVFALVTPTRDVPRAGAAALMEDGRWIVTLVGMAGERPPLDPDGFAGYAAGLPAGVLHEAIAAGQPLDDAVGFHYPANVRRRYERLRDFPEGLLVAGDAVCGFNPIYGQGMSVAALEAVTLARLLETGDVPAARTWFRAVARVVDTPWDMAVGGDLAVDRVEGRRGVTTRLANAYMERFYRAAATDPVLSVLFTRVTSLLDAPGRLLRPATVARVVRGNLRRRAGARPTGVEVFEPSPSS